MDIDLVTANQAIRPACTAPDWKRFRTVSAAIGLNPGLVQGAGGNVSLKHDGILWIKASGKWLADADDGDIFVPVELESARARVRAGEDDFGSSVLGAAGLRPSIETGMHVLLPQRIVLHLHSVNVLCYAVIESGAEALASLLAGMPWHWVPYARPGAPLTRAVSTVADTKSSDPLVLVLANHGLIIAANSLNEAHAMLAGVENALHRTPRAYRQSADRAMASDIATRIGGRLPEDGSINRLAFDLAALEVARLGPLYPDHVVFLGATPAIEYLADPGGFAWDGLNAPYVIVPQTGVIVRRDITANAEAMLGCWAAMTGRINVSERIVTLPEAAIFELLDWDAEKYRQSLARGSVE